MTFSSFACLQWCSSVACLPFCLQIGTTLVCITLLLTPCLSCIHLGLSDISFCAQCAILPHSDQSCLGSGGWASLYSYTAHTLHWQRQMPPIVLNTICSPTPGSTGCSPLASSQLSLSSDRCYFFAAFRWVPLFLPSFSSAHHPVALSCHPSILSPDVSPSLLMFSGLKAAVCPQLHFLKSWLSSQGGLPSPLLLSLLSLSTLMLEAIWFKHLLFVVVIVVQQ